MAGGSNAPCVAISIVSGTALTPMLFMGRRELLDLDTGHEGIKSAPGGRAGGERGSRTGVGKSTTFLTSQRKFDLLRRRAKAVGALRSARPWYSPKGPQPNVFIGL